MAIPNNVKQYTEEFTSPLAVWTITHNLGIKPIVQVLIDVGSVADGKSMGNVIKVQIDSLIKQGNIKNANDLMIEYRKLPPNFVNLNLKLDEISDVPTPRYLWPVIFWWNGICVIPYAGRILIAA